MTKHAAILFELPGSCDYWKDERLHEVVHDGTSHEFDGCRYGLKQRYAKASANQETVERRFLEL